jgi:hypothetical protein
MYLPLKGENFYASKLAMQSNCNGPLIIVEQAKKSNGLRRQGGGGNLNSIALA